MKEEKEESNELAPKLDEIVNDIQDIVLHPFSWMEIVLETFVVLTILSIVFLFKINNLPFLFLIWLTVSSISYYIRYKKSKKMIRKYYEENYQFEEE